jgi:hypothetical protein
VTEQQAIELITATFVAQWPALQPQVPYVLENRKLLAVDTFVHLSVLSTEAGGGQLTSGEAGTRLVGRGGWIVVKIWTPAGIGVLAARRLVESVRAVFEMQNLVLAGDNESVDTQATVPMVIGTDGHWFMMLARTPFAVYETK